MLRGGCAVVEGAYCIEVFALLHACLCFLSECYSCAEVVRLGVHDFFADRLLKIPDKLPNKAAGGKRCHLNTFLVELGGVLRYCGAMLHLFEDRERGFL